MFNIHIIKQLLDLEIEAFTLLIQTIILVDVVLDLRVIIATSRKVHDRIVFLVVFDL